MAANYNYGGYTAPEGINNTQAVKQAQKELGVTVDGLWGPKTQAAWDSKQNTPASAPASTTTPYTQVPMYAGDFGMGAMQQSIQSSLAATNKYYQQLQEQSRQDALAQGKAAYADYANFTNPYGMQREAQNGMGLTGSGLAESTLSGAYNTYQNRASGVKRDLNRVLAEYETAMAQARAQGDMQMAQAAQQAAMAQMSQMQWQSEMLFNQEKAAQDYAMQQQQLAMQQAKSSSGGSSSKSSSYDPFGSNATTNSNSVQEALQRLAQNKAYWTGGNVSNPYY